MGATHEPFAANTSKLTRHDLRHCRKLHRNVYVHREARPTAHSRAQAALLWAGDNGVLAGLSSAALHGSKWVDDSRPAYLIRRPKSRGSIPGIVVHAVPILPDEVEIIEGMPVTTAARTAFDLGRWLELDDAIEMIDALCNASGLKPEEIAELSAKHPGANGLRKLRRALSLVDAGAESPAETRTRLVLIRAGLPWPKTQVKVRDQHGRLVAICDLGWKRWKVVVEYDGDDHWRDEHTRARDIRRYALLARLGWRVVRVNSKLLRMCPHEVVEEVLAQLRAAGADV